MMTTYYLHGALGRKFLKEWKFDVETVAEGIRAIDMHLNGELRRYWQMKGRDKKYRVKLGKYAIEDEKELTGPVGSCKEVHIVPVVKGAGSGAGKILAAVAIVVAMYVTGGLSGAFTATGWAAASGGGLSVGGMMAVSAAASLLIGGVVQLLTPIPNFNQNAGNDASGNGSKIFEGNSAAIIQGDSVPVVYGRMLVSPMPLSLSLRNVSTNNTSNALVGGVDTFSPIGGGIQYRPGDPTDNIPGFVDSSLRFYGF